ncbi:MAG TPA: YtxH domain-containing protein [Bryobacteraceae bacterium]|nr:YtxH domain-containing protein [Bryobacteraceae bacterium]
MSDNNKLTAFAMGFGIGIAVGILFAPRAGEQTRQLLRSKAEEGKGYLKKQGDTLCGSAGDLVEKSKGAVARQKDQLTAAVEAGKRAYREAVADTPADEAPAG